jgi:hypothetical protein
MQYYRAYMLDQDGHIFRAIDLHCENDDAAKARAQQLVDGGDVEIWQCERRIALFEKGSRQ